MVVQLFEALCYKAEGHGFNFQYPMVYTEFFIDLILLAAVWALGLTQPLNRNEYME